MIFHCISLDSTRVAHGIIQSCHACVTRVAMKYEIYSMVRMGFMYFKKTKLMECAEEIIVVDESNEEFNTILVFRIPHSSLAHCVILCDWAPFWLINDFTDYFGCSQRSICVNSLFRDYS